MKVIKYVKFFESIFFDGKEERTLSGSQAEMVYQGGDLAIRSKRTKKERMIPSGNIRDTEVDAEETRKLEAKKAAKAEKGTKDEAPAKG